MPSKKSKSTSNRNTGNESSSSADAIRISPESIQGVDDAGRFYANHAALEAMQTANRSAWYAVNDLYWRDGGYGGKTDDEVMVGDNGGEEDAIEGLAFLDRVLASSRGKQIMLHNAIDAGAGLGRITKHILLKRFDSVHLIEADPHFYRQSRNYLGKKRSHRCTFTNSRIENVQDDPGSVDLVWCQWTLQYLTDQDVVHTLQTLAARLVKGAGIMIVKENRPYGGAREDRFQMDTPEFSGRYDITRTDQHHRLLFQRAGLCVEMFEVGVETHTYALFVA